MIKTKTNTNKLVKIAILSAAAFIVMLFEFPLPFMPPFLKFDFSDLPALIATFSLGPIAGIICELIKNLLYIIIKGSGTGFVGELANFLIGSSLCLVAGVVYNIHKTKKMAILSLGIATIFMALIGCIVNYYVLIPFYESAMNFPIDAIVNMCNKVNLHIVDKFTLILFGIFPFNLIKGIIISLITLIIYKSISKLL